LGMCNWASIAKARGVNGKADGACPEEGRAVRFRDGEGNLRGRGPRPEAPGRSKLGIAPRLAYN